MRTSIRAATPSLSTWSSLRHVQFRALWQSGSLNFVGNAMQTMAAAWMMIELTGSSFLAARVRTAVFLPMFLLSLPAGVLADITDRRRCCSSSSCRVPARRCCRPHGTRPLPIRYHATGCRTPSPPSPSQPSRVTA
jgi:hypothetical protein